MASSGNGASTESMYVGRTGGIFRFVDEGQNWENIANHEVFGAWNRLFKVIIDPISPTTLFVATKDGLYKGTNCNTSNPTWNEVEDGFFYDIEYKPGSNSLLYATAFINGAWKVMNSTDYGQSWQAMIPQPPGIFNTNVIRDNRFTIEVSKAKPDSLYLATRHLSSFNFYYLDVPNATSWSPIGNYTGGDFEFGDGHGFGVDQTNGVDILTSKGLRIAKYNISTGIVWSNADVVHVDVEDIIYHPYNTNEVWACTHGGVEKSPDGGVNWTDKYNGLGVAQVELMATSFSNPEYVMAGLYHDGTQLTRTQYSQNWNPQWEHVFDWDGMKPVIDNKDPNNMWASGQEGVWAYSDVKFNNQYYTQFSNYRSAFFHNVGVINKQNSSIFFWNQFSDTGIEDVYRSDGYGLTGTGVTNEFISEFSLLFPSSHEVYILGLVTPYTDENYLLAFIRDEHYDSNNNKEQRWHLFRTTNANNQNVAWTELDIPTDEWTISSVEFHPENPDIIYLAYTEPPSGFYATPEDFVVKIDYTIPSNPDIEDLTGNLQHTYTRANCLAAVNDNNDGLYFATEFGVFYTNSELQEQTNEEWKLVGTKLPHCRNTGLEINYFCNKLRIGTHGRGTWELPLPCDLNTQALEISTDTTWNSFMRIDRIVNVNSGATLTISSDARVGFLEDAKIIVKPGGKLVIDGGTLT
nr:hypothetical protein [Bacteroidota bacterium]